jgi:hypothetical protein
VSFLIISLLYKAKKLVFRKHRENVSYYIKESLDISTALDPFEALKLKTNMENLKMMKMVITSKRLKILTIRKKIQTNSF